MFTVGLEQTWRELPMPGRSAASSQESPFLHRWKTQQEAARKTASEGEREEGTE